MDKPYEEITKEDVESGNVSEEELSNAALEYQERDDDDDDD